MKDFIKWLGVNEKIAKVAVWLLIIMVTLIIVNTALASLGFPNYQITYDNIKNISTNVILDTLSRILVCFLNFYSILLIIFRVKEIKRLFKYSIIYVLFNIIITQLFGYIGVQAFIILFFIVFSYMYSNKNKKYLIYSLGALALNVLIEGVAYTYKLSLIDITSISILTRSLLSLDYFIIMGIIILVKEIYMKKRGEKYGEPIMVGTIQKRRKTSQENSKKSK
ncbi:MAG: hypothetical protein ACI31R_03440 [Bacilli bacterium]